MSNKKIKYLVADTTAFINAVPLNDYAENVLTVPDVIAEVRNKRQIRRLCVLPFDLQVREPRPDSIRHCVEFAKKTGDYASLSGIDIKVIALTYELEIDFVGKEHLRAEPVMSKVVASNEKPDEFKDNTKLAGWYDPKPGNESESEVELDDSDDEAESAEDNSNEGFKRNNEQVQEEDAIKIEIEHILKHPQDFVAKSVNDMAHQQLQDDEDITQEELDKLFEKLKCSANDIEHETNDILVPQDEVVDDPERCDSAGNVIADDVEDDGGWITPGNIKNVKKSLEGKVEADIVPTVACMSTDFALQNVLKQINLQISALNGRVIKHLRTYILRCYACFKTTSIMTKVFCPNCGNKTLKRVAVSLDEDGKQVIHINTRKPLTAKYKNQSLPRFRGGKHSRNPILFEDQPIPRQMPSRVAKTKTNALDEDYIAGFSPFVMRDVDSKSAMLRSKGNLKEWARNNTFEEDRRKKHYNRLCK